jgi:hypothetical protein
MQLGRTVSKNVRKNVWLSTRNYVYNSVHMNTSRQVTNSAYEFVFIDSVVSIYRQIDEQANK